MAVLWCGLPSAPQIGKSTARDLSSIFAATSGAERRWQRLLTRPNRSEPTCYWGLFSAGLVLTDSIWGRSDGGWLRAASRIRDRGLARERPNENRQLPHRSLLRRGKRIGVR